MAVGDTVVRRSTVRAIDEKLGRSGRLCFVTVEHAIDTRAGPAITESHTIVYRGEGPAVPVQKPAMEELAPHRREVAIDPVLLFRYSALTFNGHRIHYDAPYAIGVEGYAGLVIHGPLQATLLLNFAAEIKGHKPRRFSFRGVAPAVGAQTLALRAREGGGQVLLLEALNAEGTRTMKAIASW